VPVEISQEDKAMKQFLLITATALGLAMLCTALLAQETPEEDTQASPMIGGTGSQGKAPAIRASGTQGKAGMIGDSGVQGRSAIQGRTAPATQPGATTTMDRSTTEMSGGGTGRGWSPAQQPGPGGRASTPIPPRDPRH
jgi:hypothetical protein